MAAALLISGLLLTCAHGQDNYAGILRFPTYQPITIGRIVSGNFCAYYSNLICENIALR